MMTIRPERSQQFVKRVNFEWGHVIPIARNPKISQAEHIGALIVAYRALEHVVSTTVPGGGATERKLTVLRGIIPDYMEIARAKDIGDREPTGYGKRGDSKTEVALSAQATEHIWVSLHGMS